MKTSTLTSISTSGNLNNIIYDREATGLVGPELSDTIILRKVLKTTFSKGFSTTRAGIV